MSVAIVVEHLHGLNKYSNIVGATFSGYVTIEENGVTHNYPFEFSGKCGNPARKPSWFQRLFGNKPVEARLGNYRRNLTEE